MAIKIDAKAVNFTMTLSIAPNPDMTRAKR
jgi:hypothetical protein